MRATIAKMSSAAIATLALVTVVGCSETTTPRGDTGPADGSSADQHIDLAAVDGRLDLPADVAPESSVDSFGADTAPDLATSPREVLLFDKPGLKFKETDRGFLPLIEPGDPLPMADWATPHDFYDGELRIRYAISAPATQAAGKLQVCIWTMGNADGDGKNYFPESCSDSVSHTGVGTYFNKKLVPSTWWKHSGVPLVFAHPERFLIRVVLRGASGCNVTNYNVSNGCWDQWPQYRDMTFRVTLVMVAKGSTFSGWSNYP